LRKSSPEDARTAGRLAIAYMMAIASATLRRFPVDMLDLLLITTIANYNVMADEAARRNAALVAATPRRAGISRNAVSRALNIPLETVRRRIAALVAKKVLVEQADGLAFSPDNPIGLGNNADLAAFNLELLAQLFRDLKACGIELE
jgi:hypothetical protein